MPPSATSQHAENPHVLAFYTTFSALPMEAHGLYVMLKGRCLDVTQCLMESSKSGLSIMTTAHSGLICSILQGVTQSQCSQHLSSEIV